MKKFAAVRHQLPTMPLRNLGICIAALPLIGGCASADRPFIPAPLNIDARPAADNAAELAARAGVMQTGVSRTPLPPAPAKLTNEKVSPVAPATNQVADITLAFDQIPLPTLIQLVYGSALKKNYSVDPQVSARQDLVTIRTGAPQTASQVEATMRDLLKSYRVAVIDAGGFLRIVPDAGMGAYAAEIRRGRALPDTPLPLRPIFYNIEMQAVSARDVAATLQQMFADKIKIQPNAAQNALLLSGQSNDIDSALEAIQVLDQPMLRGRQGVKVVPVYWSAEELSKRLTEVLSAEGYFVGAPTQNTSISILPVAAINGLIFFTLEPAVMNHVLDWVRELDRPGQIRGGGYFTYPVKYTDAEDLAKTLGEIISGAAPATQVAGQGAARTPTRVVVNRATNSLILQGNAEEYTRWVGLLQELDRPAKTALIEVTVAEVNLTKNESLGVEWLFNGRNHTVTGGTLGGLGIGSEGLTVTWLRSLGDARAVLNALASDKKAKILSSPRIMARNGEQATITVGQDVPILTSQQSGSTTGVGTSTGIISTIQYRNTGVILKVRPIIHSGDRIEVEVSQEVSSADATKTGVNTSPTFSTRKIDTKLPMRDGATVLLGGLMSETNSVSDTGVPFLKDIPVAGQLFKTKSDAIVKTELIVLITPYVIRDDMDAQSITDAFRNRLGPWAQAQDSGGGVPQRPAPVAVLPSATQVTPDMSTEAAVPVPTPALPVQPPRNQSIPVESAAVNAASVKATDDGAPASTVEPATPPTVAKPAQRGTVDPLSQAPSAARLNPDGTIAGLEGLPPPKPAQGSLIKNNNTKASSGATSTKRKKRGE
ncbi:type II secretion system protein D [Chitinimonas naiadis]